MVTRNPLVTAIVDQALAFVGTAENATTQLRPTVDQHAQLRPRRDAAIVDASGRAGAIGVVGTLAEQAVGNVATGGRTTHSVIADPVAGTGRRAKAAARLAGARRKAIADMTRDPVGKAIDPHDHVAAGLEGLGSFITPRTVWLIEHHMQAQKILDGTIGARARRRLQANESYEELVSLAQCDRDGRQRGVEAPDLDEALDYLRDLAVTFN